MKNRKIQKRHLNYNLIWSDEDILKIYFIYNFFVLFWRLHLI